MTTLVFPRRRWGCAVAVLTLLLTGCGLSPDESDDVASVDSALGCGELRAGDQLQPGQTITSCGGKLLLAMQGDGNLVSYYAPLGIPLWASQTNGKPGAWAAMQGDGNFVLYHQGRALFSTATEREPGARFAIQNDGNLVVYTSDNRVGWKSDTALPGTRCGMSSTDALQPGQSVSSCNGQHTLVLQGDGNLVVYNQNGQATWASGTTASPGRTAGALAAMQGDGNFVIYDAGGQPLWASGTSGNTLAGLTVDDDGTVRVLARDFSTLWTSRPATSPSVPSSLVAALSVKPYVEQSCTATSFPGWPHPAQRCSYGAGGLSATVTVANPSPDRVARWIVDSASMIPALASLAGRDQGAYESGLNAIGRAMLLQSSRIFPLSGGVIENQGSGYINYGFENGVTRSCGSGCYCRINSLHRTEWCAYQAGIGRQSRSACLAAVGSSGYTRGWASQCFENHKRSWNSDVNEHFRAKAYAANAVVSARCPGNSCSPAQVVSAVRAGFGL